MTILFSFFIQENFADKIANSFKEIKNLLASAVDFGAKIIPIFQPQNSFLVIWNVSLIFVLIFNTLTISLELAFSEMREPLFVPFLYTFLPTLLLVFNTVITLNTAYYSKGTFVNSRTQIFKKFLKTHALFDIIITLPYFLENFAGQCKVIKLMLLLRFFKLSSIIRLFDTNFMLRGRMDSTFKMIRLLMTILMIAHLLGCAWIYIGTTNSLGLFDTNWILNTKINPENKLDLYINALYFSTVTMITVGYGDISPTNCVEKIFGTIFIFLSCGVFAYSINFIGIIVQKITNEDQDFRQKLSDINFFLKKRTINSHLQTKIKSYLEYMHEEKKKAMEDINELLVNSLSSELKENYLEDYFGRLFKNSKFFLNFSDGFLRKLSQRFEEFSLAPEEILYEKGEKLNQRIYFVIRGSIKLFYPESKNQKTHRGEITFRTIKSKECFGFESILMQVQRMESAKSCGVTRIASIDFDEMFQLLKGFPKDLV